MTSLGLTTAAVPEAAAPFPLSAAVPPAAEGLPSTAAAASTAFGDLLAASFAQAEQPPRNAGADNAGAAFNTLSLADVWFAGLNVDLHSLNAGLEAEETGTPAHAMAAVDIPADAADAADAVDDEGAALMAFAECMPGLVPAPLPVAMPIDESPTLGASSEPPLQDLLVGRALSGAPGEPEGLAPQANAIKAIALNNTSEQPAPVEGAGSGAPAEPERLAPHADVVRAASLNSTAPVANVATASVVEVASRNTSTSDVGRALSGPPGEPERLAPQADPGSNASIANVASTSVTSNVGRASIAGVASTPAQAALVEESSGEEQPREQPARAIDVAPPVPQTGRTRETVAAKLAEMTGLGQSAETAPKAAPGTNLETDSQSQSQSQTQDGSAQDALATGIRDNAAAARSSDSAAVTPVFTVAPPADGGARAVLVEGAALPPAPPAATVPDPENVGRLIESMRVQMRQGVQEATVRLKPEHMGEVTISIRVERGLVSAVVNAETPAVQQWLESQEDKLRSGLSEQGLHLERFIVLRDRPQERREQQRQQQPAPRYKQQRDDTAIRFEVLV